MMNPHAINKRLDIAIEEASRGVLAKTIAGMKN